jgi:hypothetical protein
MSDTELRAEIHRIIQLTRNPSAPDVNTLESKPNDFGYTLVKCPACNTWEHKKTFYSHYSRDHRPDWKVDMLVEVMRREQF